MSKYIESMLIAISTFSHIPVGKKESKEPNYALGFFPIIGLIIGLIMHIWALIAHSLNFHIILIAAVYTVIPCLVVGGLHMDGFADVVDAISSRADVTRKREIMKDPRIGTFAVIGIVLYELLIFGSFIEFENIGVDTWSLFGVFMLSRAIAVYPALKGRLIPDSKFLYYYRSMSDITVSLCIALLLAVVAMIVMIISSGIIAMVPILVAFLTSFIAYKICSNQFYGINGDVIGFMVQTTELLTLITLIVVLQ